MTERERKKRDITKLLERKKRVHYIFVRYKEDEKCSEQEIEDYMRGVLRHGHI